MQQIMYALNSPCIKKKNMTVLTERITGIASYSLRQEGTPTPPLHLDRLIIEGNTPTITVPTPWRGPNQYKSEPATKKPGEGVPIRRSPPANEQLRLLPIAGIGNALPGLRPTRFYSDPEGAATVAAWRKARGETVPEGSEVAAAAAHADPRAVERIRKEYGLPLSEPTDRIR